MSSIAVPAPTAAAPTVASPKVTQLRVIRSEWTKFHSLRSTKVMVAVFVLLTVGLAGLISAVVTAHFSDMGAAERANFDPALDPLQGIHITQLVIGILGVMLISNEYATGMIRASLTVVPGRYPVLTAKLAVFAGVGGAAALAGTVGGFFVGQTILSDDGLQTSLTNSHSLHVVFGAATYLLLVGVIGMGLGALFRTTSASISTLAGLFFVLPILFRFLPESWSKSVGPYLPAQAGEAFWGKPDGYAISSPTVALLVLLAWTAGILVPAFVRLSRTDA
jgi:ABC-type transport system involved in multi-copper enzyme maturation permease subunit